MGVTNGGAYTVNRRARSELNLTRGTRYTLEVLALDNPFALTLSNIGGAHRRDRSLSRVPHACTTSPLHASLTICGRAPIITRTAAIVVAGRLAELLLVTTGPNINPIEYGEMTFIPDASLPDQFYYQSILYPWSTTDDRIQRITLCVQTRPP